MSVVSLLCVIPHGGDDLINRLQEMFGDTRTVLAMLDRGKKLGFIKKNWKTTQQHAGQPGLLASFRSTRRRWSKAVCCRALQTDA